MSLQYFKRELSYEAYVLHADKHEILLQINSIIFDGFGQACPNYPGKFVTFLKHLKKEVSYEVRYLSAVTGSNTLKFIIHPMFLHHCCYTN